MVAWQFQGVDAALGQNTANNAFDSSVVSPNADGSVLERLEHIQSGQGNIATKRITFTAAAFEVSTTPTVFTVSGDVMARAWGIVRTAVESDSGNDGTLSLGVEDSAAALIAATTVNETNFAAGDVWTDNGTAQADIIAHSGEWVVIANSEQIEIAVGTEDMTAGVLDLYVEWRPVTPGSTVTAA